MTSPLPNLGDIWHILETFLVVTTRGSPTGIYWVEARGTAKHLIMDSRGPHNKELSTLINVNSSEVEKSWGK